MAVKSIPILKSGYELSTYLGGDPELFLSRHGKIIGSERVIPDEGLVPERHAPIHVPVVCDGVQVEIVLPAFTCRATAGSRLASAIRYLRLKLLNDRRDMRINFDQVVEVEEAELNGLSEKSRILGCAPSLNIYEPDRLLEVPPEKLRMRSAGGHIHIGMTGFAGNRLNDYNSASKRKQGAPAHPILDDPTRMVQALDVIVGNTMVLLDIDPQAAERRLVYGRAGEYRLPHHGIEYRVLSNFWLRAYPLASLVWGLTRMTAALVYYSSVGPEIFETKKIYGYNKQLSTGRFGPVKWDGVKELLDQIDLAKVQEAINTNNPILARETWEIVKSFIGTHTAGVGESANGDGVLPLIAATLDDFEYFIEKGIDYWFPKDQALIQWLCFSNGHGQGWEAFLINTVRPERKKAEETMSPIKQIKARKKKLKEAA